MSSSSCRTWKAWNVDHEVAFHEANHVDRIEYPSDTPGLTLKWGHSICTVSDFKSPWLAQDSAIDDAFRISLEHIRTHRCEPCIQPCFVHPKLSAQYTNDSCPLQPLSCLKSRRSLSVSDCRVKHVRFQQSLHVIQFMPSKVDACAQFWPVSDHTVPFVTAYFRNQPFLTLPSLNSFQLFRNVEADVDEAKTQEPLLISAVLIRALSNDHHLACDSGVRAFPAVYHASHVADHFSQIRSSLSHDEMMLVQGAVRIREASRSRDASERLTPATPASSSGQVHATSPASHTPEVPWTLFVLAKTVLHVCLIKVLT